jgi:hypothetical protein
MVYASNAAASTFTSYVTFSGPILIDTMTAKSGGGTFYINNPNMYLSLQTTLTL